MNRIKEVLEEKGFTQIWLAEELGKSYNMVNSYVQNRRQPSLEILYQIAHILKVDVRKFLISDEDQPQIKSEMTRVPILGTASCGQPILAIEDKEGEVPISTKLLRSGEKYFILKASGTSMNNAGIYDGDLVLIRQQSHASNGENVVALIDNEATIKEFHHKGDMVILKPNSTDKSHNPIILTEEFKIQGVIEKVIS